MSIIRIREQEFSKDNLGVQQREVRFLGIPIYKKTGTTTNNNIIKQLATITPDDIKESHNGRPKAKMGFQVSD